MRPDELTAAELIAHVRRAIILPTISGNHDADLELPNGTTIGVEVTRAADPKETQAWAAAQRQRVPNYPSLNQQWTVGIRSGADMRRANSVIPDLLVDLERHRQTGHRWIDNPSGTRHADPAIAAIEEALDAAHVVYAHGYDSRTGVDGGYVLMPHKGGGAISGDDIIDAVLAEAVKKDNLDKLHAMTNGERHLFVWVDHTSGPAWAALRFEHIALPTPALPDIIDTLWIAARTSTPAGGWHPDRPHSVTPPGGWQPH